MVANNLLKLNHQKTDVVVFGTKHKLSLIKDIRITIGESTVSSSSHVRNLGVVFDSWLCMTNHHKCHLPNSIHAPS